MGGGRFSSPSGMFYAWAAVSIPDRDCLMIVCVCCSGCGSGCSSRRSAPLRQTERNPRSRLCGPQASRFMFLYGDLRILFICIYLFFLCIIFLFLCIFLGILDPFFMRCFAPCEV